MTIPTTITRYRKAPRARPRPVRARVSPRGAVVLAALLAGCARPPLPTGPAQGPGVVLDPTIYVDPLIGTAGGGHTFPGAVVPFGMVQWSPENTRGDATRPAAPGGYAYDALRIRGFSLTHLSGTGCRGASGDVPFFPYADSVTTSPSADTANRVYAAGFAHTNETAAPGYYQVRFPDGVNTELAATRRTGSARFTFPPGRPASLLIRVSDSELGSSDAEVAVDTAARTVTGSVTSGNFCGHIDAVNRRSYYTLHFVAVFDRPFSDVGTWEDGVLRPGTVTARGGTTYGAAGSPARGKGSGAYVAFDLHDTSAVGVRVGISYVSLANAEANLKAENPAGSTLEAVRGRASDAWNLALGRIRVGGAAAQTLRTFYTALYHALLHPNLFSDVNGQYRGLDGMVHTVSGRQWAQYANFSGWDVYRGQLQLVALLDPSVASDIAQSLLNQATQNGGEWDRWTHNSGATHVMEGDPSPAAVAGILAFGGRDFDVERAYASLLRAATVPTANDSSRRGCPVECVGQRPSLDEWLRLGYIPDSANAWGGAGETLEDAAADFALAQLAARLGHRDDYTTLMARAGNWKHLFNPDATAEGGYIQSRAADGRWVVPFDPASSHGFAEGSSAQYTWMVPFDVRSLFDAMGGDSVANRRLDAFFHSDDGSWALTRLGGLHADLSNEPSIGVPWLYLFSGRADATQATVRQAVTTLWSDRPDGIPGNDDLGAMSAWYVWATLGMYPGIPGRAELLLASPLFPQAEIRRATGVTITISARGAGPGAPYVHSLSVSGGKVNRAWLPAGFVAMGGSLEYELAREPDRSWAAKPADAPPSFPPSAVPTAPAPGRRGPREFRRPGS